MDLRIPKRLEILKYVCMCERERKRAEEFIKDMNMHTICKGNKNKTRDTDIESCAKRAIGKCKLSVAHTPCSWEIFTDTRDARSIVFACML